MSRLNPDLIEDVARRRTVLFLGSGVTASARTRSGARIRQWDEFLRYVAEKVVDENLRALVVRLVGEKDYLLACELVRDALGREVWQEELRNEFAQAGEVSNLHRAIISLNQRIIITTNFDKLIESAWQDCNPTATHYPQIFSKISDDVFRVMRDNRDYIVKLHGSIDDPDDMIFAKSDYNKNAYGNWAYTRFIETLLTTYTFVFIGFSMNDPAISFLVEMYAERFPDARPHYIFLPGDYHQSYLNVSKRLRRLFIVPYSEADNHKELVDLISELGGLAKGRRRELAADEWRLVTRDACDPHSPLAGALAEPVAGCATDTVVAALADR